LLSLEEWKNILICLRTGLFFDSCLSRTQKKQLIIVTYIEDWYQNGGRVSRQSAVEISIEVGIISKSLILLNNPTIICKLVLLLYLLGDTSSHKLFLREYPRFFGQKQDLLWFKLICLNSTNILRLVTVHDNKREIKTSLKLLFLDWKINRMLTYIETTKMFVFEIYLICVNLVSKISGLLDIYPHKIRYEFAFNYLDCLRNFRSQRELISVSNHHLLLNLVKPDKLNRYKRKDNLLILIRSNLQIHSSLSNRMVKRGGVNSRNVDSYGQDLFDRMRKNNFRMIELSHYILH
jgi:hypothetical protein